MKKLLLCALTASLLLLPLVTCSAEHGTAKAVSQSLVREGDYAIKLVETLKLGKVTDDIKAEDVLAAAGIAPKSGWISNFPVTPAVVAQVRVSVRVAAKAGKVHEGWKEADRSVLALNKKLGLSAIASAGGKRKA